MKITITLETSGAAFDDAPGAEVSRILREVTALLSVPAECGPGSVTLHDVNGNACGRVEVAEGGAL